MADFSLTDQFGRPVDQSTYRGHYLLVYFGFTHCKVVCPRSLARLSSVLERLGEAADAVTPLYITVDPARDTPEVMRSYLEQSYPRFTGLTGTEAQIDAAKKAFRVFAQRRPDDKDSERYDVPHTAIAYLMSPAGAYLAHFTDAVDEDTVVQRMAAYLRRVSD